MHNLNITLDIAKAVLPQRKRTERIIGFAPYTLSFSINQYEGKSQKELSLNVLEQTILRLIDRGIVQESTIAMLLGLNMNNTLETDILKSCLQRLDKECSLIKYSKELCQINKKGIEAVKTGVFYKTTTSAFNLIIDKAHPDFIDLDDLQENKCTFREIDSVAEDANLSIDQIRNFAGKQATHVHYLKNKLELISCQYLSSRNYSIDLYIVLVQNISNDKIATYVCDTEHKKLIPSLSKLFNKDNALKEQLLKQCIIENTEVQQIEKSEKPQVQINYEQRLLNTTDIEKSDATQNDTYEQKVGKIYDTPEFEYELESIFSNNNNEEVWLISPWIKKAAFLGKRRKSIVQFLDRGGAVFIGYSAPERQGEEMVDIDCMNIIRQLDSIYPKFYYLELPVFHIKNVIEYRKGITTLYSGSFNVLSFYIDNDTKYYRLEQMAVANKGEATKNRMNNLELFAHKYIKEVEESIKNSAPNSTVVSYKLDYLSKYVDKSLFDNLNILAKEYKIKLEKIDYSDIPNESILLERVRKVLRKEPNNRISAYLERITSLLFLYLYAKANNKRDLIISVTNNIVVDIHNTEFILKLGKFNCRKSQTAPYSSDLFILIDQYLFYFEGIDFNRDFRKQYIDKHKEFIEFKDKNIINVNSNLNSLLHKFMLDEKVARNNLML